MQIIQSKTNPARPHDLTLSGAGGFVEKILRDKEGKLVRARFAVYENAGRIKARLVDFVYIEEKAISGNILSLGVLASNKISSKFRYSNKISSPYFNKESLYFSGSKPRAPTF